MNDRIFLRKYRVSAAEINFVGESDELTAYQGVEIDSGKKVLVELFPAQSAKNAMREQLEADAVSVKKLNHVNIPALYDFGVENDRLVYVSEHFDGTVAEKWVCSYGPMPVSPVLHIVSQVMNALVTAAFHRVVHHHINPGNLLLIPGETADGQWPLVKVLHFAGNAPDFAGNGFSAANSAKLSPYASPEQIQQGTVDFRSEVYSLGSTMLFLLTGAPASITPSEQPSRPGLPVDKLKGVPTSVSGLLAQMLSVDPEARPGDPLAFSRMLQDCLTHLQGPETMTRTPAVSSPPAERIEREKPESQWNRTRVLVVVTVPIAITAFAFLGVFGYSRLQRTVPAREPIKKPVKVAAGRTYSTPATIAVRSEMNQTLATKGAEKGNAPGVGTDFVQRAAVNLVLPLAWPRTLSLFRSPRPPEAGYVTPSSIITRPGTTNSSKITSTTQVEIPTAPIKSPNRKTGDVSPKKITTREVRRAEPAAPADGPADGAPGKVLTLKRTGVEPKPSPSPRAKDTDWNVKPKRKADDEIRLSTPTR